jgi:formylglycine-generating enzyme required for sulfatase activity
MNTAWVYDLFVSYAAEDRAWVEEYLLTSLAASGVRCTSEVAFAAGLPRLAEFDDAFRVSHRLLFVLSPSYLANPYSGFLNIVADACGVPSNWPALVLILQPVAIPPELTPLIALDATQPQQWAAVLADLARKVGQPAPAPVAAGAAPTTVAADSAHEPARGGQFVYCSHCGTRNLRTSRYCDQCSAPLFRPGAPDAAPEGDGFTASVPVTPLPPVLSPTLSPLTPAGATSLPPPVADALPVAPPPVAPPANPSSGDALSAPATAPPRTAAPRRGGIPLALSAVAVVALVLIFSLVFIPRLLTPAPATPSVPPTAPPNTPPAGTIPPASATAVVAAGTVAAPTPAAATPSPVGQPSATAVVAAASPTNAPLPSPVGQLVWQDDFSLDVKPTGGSPTPSAPDLYALANRSGLEGTDMNEPGFTVGVHLPGVYNAQLRDLNEIRWMPLTRFAYGDFSMQVDIWDNSDTRVGGLGQGILFRQRDPDHFYALLLNPRGRQYTLRKLDGADHWVDLIPWKISTLIKPRDGHNQLRLDAVGDKFTFYLNGTLLDSASDPGYRFGMPGLIVANTDATNTHTHFDDLQIWNGDPAGAAAKVDPEKKMVRIPAGEFVMGWYDSPDEMANIVALPEFSIDLTEVTNQDYRNCVTAKGCTAPGSADSSSHRDYFTQEQFDTYPVINVSWQQATDYCRWAGKRLPTEAEWEKAAGWDLSKQAKTIWPWAENTFDPNRLNSSESSPVDTTPVGKFGPELNGTFDMAGNVREWTSSLYRPYPYNAADGREAATSTEQRVYRGGSWEQSWGKAKTFVREGADPDYSAPELGFRCAATP